MLTFASETIFEVHFLSGFQWVWDGKSFTRGMEWEIGANTQEGTSHLIGNKGEKLLHRVVL